MLPLRGTEAAMQNFYCASEPTLTQIDGQYQYDRVNISKSSLVTKIALKKVQCTDERYYPFYIVLYTLARGKTLI